MTLESEDNCKSYYVVCLDILGFGYCLHKKEYNLVGTAISDFYQSVFNAIQYRHINETTCYIILGDSLYYICEKLETTIDAVASFGDQCIGIAIDLFQGMLIHETPFMARGAMAFGPILLTFSDDTPSGLLRVSFQKQTGNAFNAVGLPVNDAYQLSEKLKGIRVAIHDSVNVETKNYGKYFAIVTDSDGNSCREFLWPLYIFERKDQGYIQKSLEAFWYLYGKNRGKHEIHYLSTLALLWKSIDEIPGCTIAEEFFETKDLNQVNRIRSLKYLIKEDDVCGGSMKKKIILDLATKQELLSRSESVKFDWRGDLDKGIIIKNQRLGVTLYYYAVLDENNCFKYDTFGIEERDGNCVSVVLNRDNEICLLKEHRFMPNKYFLSCPRGFSDFRDEKRLETALREVKEEVGEFEIIETIDLGNIYQNTTFFLKPVGVILVKLKIDKNIEINKHQQSEDIEEVAFYEVETVKRMIKDGKIECLITLGALSKYFCYVEMNDS